MLTWEKNTKLFHLHNFNVCIPERESLGMRLASLAFYCSQSKPWNYILKSVTPLSKSKEIWDVKSIGWYTILLPIPFFAYVCALYILNHSISQSLNWLMDRLIACLINWLMIDDWLIDWLIDQLIGYLINQSMYLAKLYIYLRVFLPTTKCLPPQLFSSVERRCNR